jgi:hypothetical protein
MSQNTSGHWLTVREAAEREDVSKTAIQKRIARFEKTRNPARLKGYADVCQDERGNYLLLLPDNQPQTLEVVSDGAQLPAVPTPDTSELAARLAQVAELLERQQAHNERLVEQVTQQAETIGKLRAERDALQAQLERLEPPETHDTAQDESQVVRRGYNIPREDKRSWWQRLLNR